MTYNPKIVIWNVRGLNARARRLVVCSLIATTDASIVCLQETKMALVYSRAVLETMGVEFDEYVYLSADGTPGGILLAWKSRAVAISNLLFTTNILTAKVSTPESASWWISVVYGPQDDDAKVAFLQEIGTYVRTARVHGCSSAISTSSFATRTRTTILLTGE